MSMRLPIASLVLSSLLPTLAAAQDPFYELRGDQRGAWFGYALDELGDIDGDGAGDIVVGEPWGSTQTPWCGRVFVYSGASGVEIYRIEGTSLNARVGYDVAGPGDVNADGIPDILVGAPFEGTGGRVRVHSGVDASVLFTLSGAYPGGWFGASVDGAGDVNLDGVADLVISAPREGAVYVYSGSDGSLVQTIPNLIGFGFNGTQLPASGLGDVDGDGRSDLVVGEPFATNYIGRASVFKGGTGAIIHRWNGDDTLDGWYGWDVDGGVGDIDGDLLPDLIVGHSHKIVVPYARGEIILFSGGTGAELGSVTGRRLSGTLGRAVAGVGDVNGDGVPDVLGGAPEMFDGQGEALLVSGRSGAVLHIFPSLAEDGGRPVTGSSLCGAGDINSDGLTDFVIGAAGETSNTGVVRVYLGEDLYLRPFRYFVDRGDTLDLTTTGGMPWALSALHVTKIDGQPASIPLDFGTLDADGERVFTVFAPPGTGVQQVTFQAFAIKGGIVVASSEVDVEIR